MQLVREDVFNVHLHVAVENVMYLLTLSKAMKLGSHEIPPPSIH